MPEAIHEGHRQRMRERFLKSGAESFADHELLEFLLYYCIKRRDTNKIAHKMLNEFGTLPMLLDADPRDVARRCNVSESVALFLSALPEVIKRYYCKKWDRKTTVNNHEDAGQIALSLLAFEQYECFYIICLDNQNRVITSSLLSEGTLNEAMVYPRFVVECALRYKASAVILTHNHPGGNLNPSFSDIEATRKIVRALNLIDISVFDHIIVADNKYVSFRANNYFRNHIKEAGEPRKYLKRNYAENMAAEDKKEEEPEF